MSRTAERRVHDRLVAAVSIVPFAKLLAWSPTNAKAYTQPSAVLKVKEGGRTKSYRVDVVFAVNHVLVLAESKGRSSESDDDVLKLRSMRDNLGLNGVIQQLARQGIEVPSDVTALAIAVAVETVDTNVPDDLVFLRVTEQALEVTCGQAVEPSIVEALAQMADYLRKNSK